MCGFAGILSKQKIYKKKFLKIAKAVNFRGPDNTGIRIFDYDFNNVKDKGNIAIFHNRLAIIDVDERSNQPFEDETYLLVFNGEIYNFQEIKQSLIILGYTFKTESDTEVLFIALKEWGEKCISKLNGMFSFVFINKKLKKLLISRDRTGIKPLYFFLTDSKFIFSSETDTIVRLLGYIPEINKDTSFLYTFFQYIPDNKSIWKGINSFPPGNYAFLDISKEHFGELKLKKYWNLISDNSKNKLSLKEKMINSLSRHLISDAPMGLSLSSGVDSSLLTALITRYFPNIFITYFTISFEESNVENDESKLASNFLKNLNINNSQHKNISITSDLILEEWKGIYEKVDLPFGDHAILLNSLISKYASKECKVLLSGDGADEVFAGYERYRLLDVKENFSSLRRKFYRLLNYYIKRKSLSIYSAKNFIDKYLFILDPTNKSYYEIKKIKKDSFFVKEFDQLSFRADLARLIDMKSYLPGGMLFKVDRSSMSSSIESRVPYLDNELLEEGLREANFNIKKSLKWQLRELLIDEAPFYNKNLSKKGFSFPLFRWMSTDWLDKLLDLIDKNDCETLGINYKEIFQKFCEVKNGNYKHAYDLWIKLNLLLWFHTKKDILNY